jgi:hypothetical protein
MVISTDLAFLMSASGVDQWCKGFRPGKKGRMRGAAHVGGIEEDALEEPAESAFIPEFFFTSLYIPPPISC